MIQSEDDFPQSTYLPGCMSSGSTRSSSGLHVQGPMVFVWGIPSSNFTSGQTGSQRIPRENPEARSCGRIHFNGHAVDGIEGVPVEGREDWGIFFYFCKKASAYILLLNVLFTYDIDRCINILHQYRVV